MNIYFSCSLTGGRDDETVYGIIVGHLLAGNHEVPTAHLARPEVMLEERVVDPYEVYDRDIEWIDGCDVLIAEVSTPSHGVGYEIAYALLKGKPVFCCYKDTAAVSKMLTGNRLESFEIHAYKKEEHVLAMIDQFLS
jgi:2'-deoxynucleoside 5'-phosphate N-hydrolase